MGESMRKFIVSTHRSIDQDHCYEHKIKADSVEHDQHRNLVFKIGDKPVASFCYWVYWIEEL
jgi:hypothetical protein